VLSKKQIEMASRSKGSETSEKRVRRICSILSRGPQNESDVRLRAKFFSNLKLAYHKHFSHLGLQRHLLDKFIQQALVRLKKTEVGFRNAVMCQDVPDEKQFLELVANEVSLLVAEDKKRVPSTPVRSTSSPVSHPNDCCQECGVYLLQVCYSERKTNGRVPRTEKICKRCFAKLSKSQQARHYEYNYAPFGFAIRGTGLFR
jgi:hypothetical protein